MGTTESSATRLAERCRIRLRRTNDPVEEFRFMRRDERVVPRHVHQRQRVRRLALVEPTLDRHRRRELVPVTRRLVRARRQIPEHGDRGLLRRPRIGDLAHFSKRRVERRRSERRRRRRTELRPRRQEVRLGLPYRRPDRCPDTDPLPRTGGNSSSPWAKNRSPCARVTTCAAIARPIASPDARSV